MTKNEVSVKFPITDEQIKDIMSSASYGIGYWVDAYKCNYTRHNRDEDELTFETTLQRGGYIRLHDAEGNKYVTLTMKKLLKAIGQAVVGDKTSGPVDIENYDQNDADVIIQRAVFGEVVYG